MARVTPLWESNELRLYRFDHPVEHEDQAYEACADVYRVSFVEEGRFTLSVDDTTWGVGEGDVMVSHPGMRFRAGFEGKGFNDTCLSLVYLAAGRDNFDSARTWEQIGRPVLKASNRLLYLRWLLQRAVERNTPMLAEFSASELFHAQDDAPGPLFRDHKFSWYADRVQAAREQLHAEYDREHTVSALARSVGMSMFHFTRVFTELVGRPPHRYLAEIRLLTARSMLEQGRPVTETCYACGFNNLSHFSRSFARRFGVAPSRLSTA